MIKEAFATSAEFYQKWQGFYASAVLLALEPGIFGDKYYALTGILLLAIIVGGKLRGYGLYLSPQMRLPETGGFAAGCVSVVSYDRMDALRPAKWTCTGITAR